MLALTSGAQAGERQAVIELFTSQGCSSCPPADKLIGQLTQNPALVALSLPINYWDYLGWKDTLALPRHTQRQYAYAHARGDRQVYTPQVVVNGVMHVLGSDKAAIEKAIAQSRLNPDTMAVPVKVTVANGAISVNVPQSTLHGVVWLCGVRRAADVKIGRGENHGRTITYHNVVRGWHMLGEWSGKPASWNVPVSDLKGSVDEAAVIVQERHDGNPSRVLGASIVGLQ
jgi:hypothetical protein